jgi:endonuclease/exonuclease/phosphatase family metal-dependent hydrolase
MDADFIGLQEVNFGVATSALDSTATRLGMKSAAHAVRWNDRYSPYAPGMGPIVSGQTVWSRFPIRQHVRTRVNDSTQTVWGRWLRPEPVVQTTVVDIGGWPLFIMNVNLDAPDVTTREQHAREVNRLYLRLASLGMPVLVIGSINGPMSSAAAFSSDGGSASSDNDTVELLLRGTSLQPAFYAEGARITGQSVATYPANTPRRKVDYIFYRPGRIAPTDANIRCGDPSPSRHCAVTLSFLLPRPVDQLPEERIPDDQLPSLDSLLHAGLKN